MCVYTLFAFATHAFLGHCSESGLKPRGVTSAQRLSVCRARPGEELEQEEEGRRVDLEEEERQEDHVVEVRALSVEIESLSRRAPKESSRASVSLQCRLLGEGPNGHDPSWTGMRRPPCVRMRRWSRDSQLPEVVRLLKVGKVGQLRRPKVWLRWGSWSSLDAACLGSGKLVQ